MLVFQGVINSKSKLWGCSCDHHLLRRHCPNRVWYKQSLPENRSNKRHAVNLISHTPKMNFPGFDSLWNSSIVLAYQGLPKLRDKETLPQMSFPKRKINFKKKLTLLEPNIFLPPKDTKIEANDVSFPRKGV